LFKLVSKTDYNKEHSATMADRTTVKSEAEIEAAAALLALSTTGFSGSGTSFDRHFHYYNVSLLARHLERKVLTSNLAAQFPPTTPERQRVVPTKTPKTPTSKHTPIAAKGTRFSWAHNMVYYNIKKGKAFELGKPNAERLVIRLTDTKGKVCQSYCST
jgi:hypothetical protein